MTITRGERCKMLLNKFRQWLGGKQADDGGAASINLSHGKMIASWLTRYQDQHQFMRVSFKENAEEADTFATGILFIDTKSKRFFLEALRPKHAAMQLTPNLTLYFQLTVDGVKHRFQTRYLKSEELPEGNAHLCEFPHTIEQVQLRNAFRVKVPRSTPVKVSLTHPKQPFLTGQAADLSASGVRMRISGTLPKEPSRGDTYPVCRLILTDGTEIFCQGQLMHWRYDADHKSTYMGIMFMKLETNHERTLGKFLNDLQRREKEMRRFQH